MTALEQEIDRRGLRVPYLRALLDAVRPRAIHEWGSEAEPNWGRILSAVTFSGDHIWWLVTATEEERRTAAEFVLDAAKAA